MGSLLGFLLFREAYNLPTGCALCRLYDLKADFPFLYRKNLCTRLYAFFTDHAHLYLFQLLYNNRTAHIFSSLRGQLTKDTPLSQGVKQGCLMALLQFNVCINDIALVLAMVNSHVSVPATSQVANPEQ